MMKTMRSAAARFVSPVNPLIAEGIATHELRGMVRLVDSCYRAALNDPKGLRYIGISGCDLRIDVASEVFKKGGTASSTETAMSDMRLYQIHLEYAGEPIKPAFLKLLFPRDYNLLMISGKMKSIAATLGDQCLSCNNSEVFVRFKRARFVVSEFHHIIRVNGLYMSQPVPWAQIHNEKLDSAGKKVGGIKQRGRAKPALFAYLLAVYGLQTAFEMVCGQSPVFVNMADHKTIRDFENDGTYSSVMSSGKKPSRSSSSAWRAPEFVAYVKTDDVTQELLICLASFFYLVEFHPSVTDTLEKINNKTAWLVLLGIINMGDLTYSTLAQAMQNHIDSVYRYFDEPSKEKFDELGIKVNDTYELLAYLVGHTHLLLCTSASKVADVTNKEVSVLADLAFNVTSAVFRLTFKISQMTSKRENPLTVAEVENLVRFFLKRGTSFSANKSPMARNASIVGDLRLPHAVKLVMPNKSGGSDKNISFQPCDAAHASQIATQINMLTTAQPFGKTGLNPFTGQTGSMLTPPIDPELYAETQALLDSKL